MKYVTQFLEISKCTIKINCKHTYTLSSPNKKNVCVYINIHTYMCMCIYIHIYIIVCLCRDNDMHICLNTEFS